MLFYAYIHLQGRCVRWWSTVQFRNKEKAKTTTKKTLFPHSKAVGSITIYTRPFCVELAVSVSVSVWVSVGSRFCHHQKQTGYADQLQRLRLTLHLASSIHCTIVNSDNNYVFSSFFSKASVSPLRSISSQNKI